MYHPFFLTNLNYQRLLNDSGSKFRLIIKNVKLFLLLLIFDETMHSWHWYIIYFNVACAISSNADALFWWVFKYHDILLLLWILLILLFLKHDIVTVLWPLYQHYLLNIFICFYLMPSWLILCFLLLWLLTICIIVQCHRHLEFAYLAIYFLDGDAMLAGAYDSASIKPLF